MLIPIKCHSCGLGFQVDARYAGKVGTCPRPDCGKKYLVPRLKQSASTPPPPAPLNRRGTKKRPAARAGQAPKTPPSTQTPPAHSVQTPAPLAWWQHPNTWIAATIGIACVGLVLVFFSQSDSESKINEVANSRAVPNQDLQLVGQNPKKPHPASEEKFQKQVLPFLKKYCLDCHGNGADEGGLTLDAFLKPEEFHANRKTAELVFKMLNAGAMPPEDGEQPSMEERQQAVDWIDAKLYYVDCELPPDPGRVTIRRLNRAEYNNTIRDLLGIDFEPAADFPSDEVGNGFDNIGDVLSLPPLLMEKYLDAAETIAQKAIVGNPARLGTQRVAGNRLKQTGGASGLDDAGFVRMPSVGSVVATFQAPVSGEYFFRAEAMADQAGPETAQMEFRVNGRKVQVVDVKGSRKAEDYEIAIKLDQGQHQLEAAFINDYYNRFARDRRQRDRNLYIRKLELAAKSVSSNLLPEPHRRIILASPDNSLTAKASMEKNLRAFIGRAFRRPALDEEVEKFTTLGMFAISRGDRFEQGMQLAVTAVLVSPHFLFRVENHAQPDDPQKIQPITDYEFASRLSYFLWSSMPDDELFALAAKGELQKPEVLEAQTRRMLKDPKSQALVENFASQWLNLRNLEDISPDPKQFPTFNNQLQKDMRKETEAFFAAVMRDDLSVDDFLDGNFTFLNERLAEHYGIPDVKGSAFQKVSLKGIPRAGVLTQASILTLTSNPTRTSPVKRGKWIMENFLNEAPPPPPPNVPELEETAKESPGLSLRKQLELHRKSPGCASCHKTMDPLGLGFENFDAIGRWRDREGKSKVDASGELPGGKKFNGPIELITILKGKKTQFRRCLAEKLLTYALGRGLEYYDRCAVDKILKNMNQDNNRFSRMVIEIVRSQPFGYRRGENSP